MFFCADTEDELLDTIDEILARLDSVELFAAAHKCTFLSREIVWCGKAYSQGRVSRDPVRLQGLSEDGGFRYILVMMDDLINFVLVEPVEVCTTEATAASLLTWCRTLGMPRV